MFSNDTLTLSFYGSIKPEAELREQTLNSDFIFKNGFVSGFPAY